MKIKWIEKGKYEINGEDVIQAVSKTEALESYYSSKINLITNRYETRIRETNKELVKMLKDGHFEESNGGTKFVLKAPQSCQYTQAISLAYALYESGWLSGDERDGIWIKKMLP